VLAVASYLLRLPRASRAKSLSVLDVDVIGANCSVGSQALVALTERLLAAGARRVSAMPTAVLPMHIGNRVIYHSSPDYMADHRVRIRH